MCYLVLCDQSFSKRLAFSFLEDLQTEFGSTYGSRVETVSRPYSFIEFGKHQSKTTIDPQVTDTMFLVCHVSKLFRVVTVSS